MELIVCSVIAAAQEPGRQRATQEKVQRPVV